MSPVEILRESEKPSKLCIWRMMWSPRSLKNSLTCGDWYRDNYSEEIFQKVCTVLKALNVREVSFSGVDFRVGLLDLVAEFDHRALGH